MALPYKLFKTLEIDGVKMGLDADWGSELFNSKDTTMAANTWTKGAEVTITEAGLYLFSARWMFGVGTTTGNKVIEQTIAIKRNGDTSYTEITYGRISNQTNTQLNHSSMSYQWKLSEHHLPALVATYGRSSVASDERYTSIKVCKLVSLGGVIRNLVNSICCRPQFGKAVA